MTPTEGEAAGEPSRVVIDASATVALLTDASGAGEWVAERIAGRAMVGPHLLLFETANILRRLELARVIDPTTAAMAHDDLLDLAIGLVAYPPVSARTRELRTNLTAYDASYVALAEALAAPLITLDARIGRAPGIRCEVIALVTGPGESVPPPGSA